MKVDREIEMKIRLALFTVSLFAAINLTDAQPYFGNGIKVGVTTEEHQYLAIIKGFLSGEIKPGKEKSHLTFRYHRVDGSVAYEYTFDR